MFGAPWIVTLFASFLFFPTPFPASEVTWCPLDLLTPCVSRVSCLTHPCCLTLQSCLCLMQPFVLTFSLQLSPCPSHPLPPSGYFCHLSSITPALPVHSCHRPFILVRGSGLLLLPLPPFHYGLHRAAWEEAGASSSSLRSYRSSLPCAQLPVPSLLLPSLCVWG